METTLILFNPDCVTKAVAARSCSASKAGFRIRGCKMMRLGSEILREHYFPTSPPSRSSRVVDLHAIQSRHRHGAGSRWRDREGFALSAGQPIRKKPLPATIRGDFGVDVMVNVVHASDSSETAARRARPIFKPDDFSIRPFFKTWRRRFAVTETRFSDRLPVMRMAFISSCSCGS